MSKPSLHDLFDGSDHSLLPDGPMTWNSGFNEAALSCGLTAADILDLDDGELIADCCWMRNGDKISVCIGNAIWTVDIADLQTHNAGGNATERSEGGRLTPGED